MAYRDSTERRIDSLEQVRQLMRTVSFHGGDSVQIGYELIGTLIGDSAAAGGARVRCHLELVDSASGIVVAELDSFEVSASERRYRATSATVVDLVTGAYYLRLAIDTANMPAVASQPYSRYPVAELFRWVDGEHLSKLAGSEGVAGGKARITAQPNPFGTSTEVRFSIPERDYATVAIFDKLGRMLAILVDNKLMEAGRYAIELEGRGLQPGSYIVELKTPHDRVVEKLILVR